MPASLQTEDVLRIPLVGSLQTRTFEVGGSTTAASGIVGIGIVGVMIVGNGGVGSGGTSITKDQHFINCWPEKLTDPFTGSSKFLLNKRPGFQTLNTPSAGNIGTAIHVWAGAGGGVDVITAYGSPNSTVYRNVTSLGAVTGKVVKISDTLVGTIPNLLISTDGNEGYYFPEGGSLTNITDADFPANIANTTITGGFVSLNGYNFIMTTNGKIYNSDLNSIANWTATSFLSSNIKPDGGLGLIRYKNYIVAMGRESIEFFAFNQDTTLGSPLIPVTQLEINIGAINQHCFKEVDDTIAWIGSTANSRFGLYVLDGLNPRRVSLPHIEGMLSGVSTDNIYLNAEVIAGKTFIFIISSIDSRTFVYCLEDGHWHEWSSETLLWTHMAGISTGIKNVYAISRTATSGKVYLINPASFVFADDGIQYPVTIQTYPQDGGTQLRKFGSKLWVIGDKYSSSNVINISWSDDDYQTFSTVRTLDLANYNQFLPAIGSFRRRVFKITQTSTMPLRLEAIEIPLKVGTH